MLKIKAIGVSEGLARAKALVIREADLTVTKTAVTDTEAEKKRVTDAVAKAGEQIAALREYGLATGLAFQIQDDILDYTPSAHTGKPANNDLREGKITLPLLSVLDRASEERRADLLARLARCHEDDEAVEYLRSTVENEGGLTFAAEVMQGYITRAVEMLADYEDSEYRSALVNLCAYIAERDR